MPYAQVRTDNLTGIYDGSKVLSAVYTEDIEDGNVVVVKKLAEGEREIYEAEKPVANSPMGTIALVAGVELMYESGTHNLDEYINKKGVPFRVYLLENGDVFSVTAEALDGDAPTTANTDKVELQAGTKLKVVKSGTASSTVIGDVIAIEQVGTKKYYVIRVNASVAAGE